MLKPILKWAGGKTQILTTITDKILKNDFDIYCEPFCGGGSVFLAILNFT